MEEALFESMRAYCSCGNLRRADMIRQFLAGAAALTLMTGAAFAQSGYSSTTTTVTPDPSVTYVQPAPTYVAPAPVLVRPDPGKNVVAGGVGGAALGAAIGCLATLPIGCAPGAAFGAAVGGGGGAVIGAVASVPPADR
jgi:hypothetical protein